MSYILDALKKSEQERGQGNIPDVQTVHSSSLNYRNEKKAYWPYILITAVILNLLAISYFIFKKDNHVETLSTTQKNDATVNGTPKDSPYPDTASQPVTKTETATSNIDKKTETTKVPTEADITIDNNEKVDEPVTQSVRPTGKEAQVKGETAAGSIATDVVEFHDLPESIKQQLPAIIISAHVYSSNPVQRSVVINNNFMEEGEYVLDGLILHEITTDGAIFNYQGTLFNYGVVSGWQ